MKVLIDTNIIIYREDNVEVKIELQELMKILQEEDYRIFIHPYSIQDVNNDNDDERRKVTLSKLNSYPHLNSPPSYIGDNDFILKIPNYDNLNSHDLIDLNILYSLYRHAVSFLITEDKKIHTWAENLGLETCYNIQDALETFKELTKKSEDISKPLPIKLIPLSNLKLEDSFFDSLRKDYDERIFNKWFLKKAEQGFKAYVYFNSNKELGAFLMLKKEYKELIKSKPNTIYKEKILKICTLKVTKLGNKLGELLLNISFNYAIKNGFDEIYLTHYIEDESDYLVSMIQKFGFIKSENYLEHNYTDKKEALFFKKLKIKNFNNSKDLRNIYFPSFFDGDETRKFIVPIQPKWHDRLFYDQRKQTFLREYYGEFIIEGNTIQKAYLSHTNCKQIREGDILIFYHSNKNQRITSVGTVDKIFYNVKSLSDATLIVGKRTVYNIEEIENLINAGPLTIILFKYHFPLPFKLTSKELVDKNIFKKPPQSIMQLEQEKYLKLKRETKIPLDFTHWN